MNATRRTGTLRLRGRGLWLVASLELKQRLRSRAWVVALAVWMIVLLGVGALGLAPVLLTAQYDGVEQVSSMIFSAQIVFVMFAMLLVVPALSAGAINGDRSAGTLATLQASLLSPAEIVLGKLLAGWSTGLAFLVLALPSLVPIALLGHVDPLYMLRLLAVIVVLTACVTALGLGLSALTRRTLSSVVLAYVLVIGVTVVLPVAWGVSGLVITDEKEVTVYSTRYTADGDLEADEPMTCEVRRETRQIPRLDLTMPLMWGNPVVLLAETAPTVTADRWRTEQDEGLDLLGALKLGMRTAAHPLAPSNFNECWIEDRGYPAHLDDGSDGAPLWPMGLGLWAIVGVAAVTLAIRRVAVPVRHLGRGERIA